MLDRQLAITYMETNNVPFIEGAEYGMGVPFQGKWYYEKSMIRMIAPKITDQQIFDMETSVKAAQTEDFSEPTETFNNIANVDTAVVATLEREKKIFKGLIFTDPITNLEVDLQEYSGEDANAIINKPPLPPTSVGLNQQTSTQLGIQYFGASDSDGSIQSYFIYIDGAPYDSTTSNSYLISGLTPDTVYLIEVYSVDNDNVQSISSAVCECRTTPSSANVAPTAPGYLASTAIGTYGASFDIKGGVDSDGSVVGYNIYIDGVYKTTTVGLFPANSPNSVNITGLSPMTSYIILVKSVDDDGAESVLGITQGFTTSFPQP